MNWSLIFKLSLFGLAMGIATISLIPSNAEFFFWLPIFIICAYIIAKNCTANYFFNGFMVSVINGVWISAAHVIFYNTYIAHHAFEATQYNDPRIPVPPKAAMFVIGLIIGVFSGLVVGLFSFIASKIVKPK